MAGPIYRLMSLNLNSQITIFLIINNTTRQQTFSLPSSNHSNLFKMKLYTEMDQDRMKDKTRDEKPCMKHNYLRKPETNRVSVLKSSTTTII